MARPALPPLPVIEEVVLSDESVPPGSALTLPPSERTMEFRFSAPLMVAADQIGFRYRLEGFEDDWVTASARRTAVYTNLPPGNYNFRVQASDREGRWSEAEATLPLELEPLLWERRTVQGAGLLVLLLLGVFGYRYRIRSLEERENRLLQVVREREETEAALRRSEERLRLALEAGDMGTWEWKLETNEVHWSHGLEGLFGESPGSRDQVEMKLAEQIPIRDLARLRHAFARVVQSPEEEVQMDFPVQRPDGRVRRVELRGRWVGDEASGQRRIMGVAADVTALVEAREALRSREEELRHAQKMEAVGQLAGGVAHDFNNLMAVIGGNTRLALDTLEPTHPAWTDLEEIRKAGDRAATLTQQLLAFSRKQVLQPRPVYLNDIIRNVERMLRTLLRDNVKLRTELSPERAPVRMDESGVEQILVNVILNAQDAMPKGGTVTISVRNGARLPSILQGQGGVESWNGHVILSISDTGQGMDESTRRRVFEPFFTTKEVGKGTGLGLASVYGIVKQSGGTVEVESEEGRGATFRFRFPQVEAPSPSPGEARIASGNTPAENPPKSRLPGTTEDASRILLVEDSDPVRHVARRILEASGYVVTEAAGGREALHLFESAPYDIDLVLTDVVMPEMDGPELAAELRTHRPDLPVLLMSGHSEDLVATMAGSDVEVQFIPKPFTPAELTQRLRNLLTP
jgi:two-component system, cell cycle sensor histidine kinase and response regulator CckA